MYNICYHNGVHLIELPVISGILQESVLGHLLFLIYTDYITPAEYTDYFATDAKYSNSYAHWLPNRHRQVFIANVLTARLPNNSLRTPPVKTMESSPDVNFKQVCYNSVTGLSGDYIIYMTYDNLKAHSAYLIIYSV